MASLHMHNEMWALQFLTLLKCNHVNRAQIIMTTVAVHWPWHILYWLLYVAFKCGYYVKMGEFLFVEHRLTFDPHPVNFFHVQLFNVEFSIFFRFLRLKIKLENEHKIGNFQRFVPICVPNLLSQMSINRCIYEK